MGVGWPSGASVLPLRYVEAKVPEFTPLGKLQPTGWRMSEFGGFPMSTSRTFAFLISVATSVLPVSKGDPDAF